MKLSDKTALVTGAANGIGRAIAVLFAAEGASVVLVDKDEPHARETADAIIAAGGRAAVCVCDVSRQEGVDAALRTAIKGHHQDSTIIMVAQRVSSIQNMTNILVLDNGRAIGYGSHEHLLASCPAYQEIYHAQMGEL